ncbi:hypothetical protein CF8_0197 [Aeromonas phage CF8]|nr:hypothetical protein CF8_0197 [Aeromonas phage CF8]
MPEYVYWIIAALVVLLYLFIGLVCFGSFGWVIGRPHRYSKRDKLIGGLWDWSVILLWPLWLITIIGWTVWLIAEHCWVVFKRKWGKNK